MGVPAPARAPTLWGGTPSPLGCSGDALCGGPGSASVLSLGTGCCGQGHRRGTCSSQVCLAPAPWAPQHWKLSPWPRPCSPGLTQYSGDAQTEWNLNSFGTKEQVLAAVHRLRYKGGNTFTGTAQAAPPSILRADLLLPPSQTLGACV